MADDKSGRETQARDADTRQRERDIAAELERMDEPEPPVPESALDDLALDDLTFPATGTEIIEAIGDQTVETDTERHEVAELVPETDAETFETPAAVRTRLQRPTVAAVLKEIVEAARQQSLAPPRGSQQAAYERTLQELKSIDADDDDEGVQAIGDWIVAQIHENEALPDSRSVRREAASWCRDRGYEIRTDEWLGV
jgi:hypothetical protein